MSVAHNQPLSILIPAIFVELNVVHYLVFDRGLQQLARSFLEQLLQKRLLFIISSLIKRDHFSLWHWRVLSFWRPRVRLPGFFFVTERMRLFSASHPQLSVIPPEGWLYSFLQEIFRYLGGTAWNGGANLDTREVPPPRRPIPRSGVRDG
jgi:hypothetical protein